MIRHAESSGRKSGLISGTGFATLLLAAILLAGCNTTARQEAAAPAERSAESEVAVAAAPQTPDSNCGRAIDTFANLLSRDLENGMVARSVHDAAMQDLEVAAGACRAGSQEQALSALRATRIRHGYPAG